MNKVELETAIDAYFANHLDKSYWESLSVETRSGAIAMAWADIGAMVTGLTVDKIYSADSAAVKAVAEQAVFLARNYADMTEGKIATSESVEGVSTGYSLIGSSFIIAPRAEAFIKQAKREILGNSVRLQRG